jgi:two-component system cell cycle response regulator DivK
VTEPAAPGHRPPIAIVYVEDNAANFALVRKILEHDGGYRVLGATTGEEGLELIERERPALVLLDLDLPGISGIEVAARLKSDERLRDIPLVAVTASVMKRERDAAIAAGCARFVEKPFDIHLLRDIVAEMVAPLTIT